MLIKLTFSGAGETWTEEVLYSNWKRTCNRNVRYGVILCNVEVNGNYSLNS